MPDRVCAVVVTYNRKNLLRACLNSLLNQTRTLDQILVVDNCSTDGTRDLVAAEYSALPVLPLSANLGGAGGFHAGMKWAYEHGFDWIWVMDDDVRMMPYTLERLMSFGDVGDLIQARKIVNGEPLIWEALWDPTACAPVAFQKDVSFENGQGWTPTVCANFEGALMKRVVIEKTGYPDVRYFIAGDDSMYGFLASLQVRNIYVNFFGMEKEVATNNPKSRLTYYFPLRNRFLSYQHLLGAGVPLNRGIFLLNTAMYLLSLLRDVAKTPKERSWRNVKTVIQSFQDGMAGRFGKPEWI